MQNYKGDKENLGKCEQVTGLLFCFMVLFHISVITQHDLCHYYEMYVQILGALPFTYQFNRLIRQWKEIYVPADNRVIVLNRN